MVVPVSAETGILEVVVPLMRTLPMVLVPTGRAEERLKGRGDPAVDVARLKGGAEVVVATITVVPVSADTGRRLVVVPEMTTAPIVWEPVVRDTLPMTDAVPLRTKSLLVRDTPNGEVAVTVARFSLRPTAVPVAILTGTADVVVFTTLVLGAPAGLAMLRFRLLLLTLQVNWVRCVRVPDGLARDAAVRRRVGIQPAFHRVESAFMPGDKTFTEH